jgi:hypothetical protein
METVLAFVIGALYAAVDRISEVMGSPCAP